MKWLLKAVFAISSGILLQMYPASSSAYVGNVLTYLADIGRRGHFNDGAFFVGFYQTVEISAVESTLTFEGCSNDFSK